MKFLVDHMLGRLARYLRFMGYDTYYPSGDMSDDEILRIAHQEGRVVITRDRELARRSGGLLLRSGDYREQLKAVVREFNLKADNMLSRCSLCNEPLVRVEKEEIRDRVPEYVYQHSEEFYLCPKCGRVYWYGSHTERIEREIREVMGDED